MELQNKCPKTRPGFPTLHVVAFVMLSEW